VYVLKSFVRGRQKFITIGTHGSPWTVEKARKRAQELLYAVRSGDPAQLRRSLTGRPTIEQLCTRFLQEHAYPHKKSRSAELDQQNIRNHVIPLLSSRFVEEVTRTDIEEFKLFNIMRAISVTYPERVARFTN
jgi:hypothetical protein